MTDNFRPFNLDDITVRDIMGSLQTMLDEAQRDCNPDKPDPFEDGYVAGIADTMSKIRSLILLRDVRDKDAAVNVATYGNLHNIDISIRYPNGQLVPAVITDSGIAIGNGAIDIVVQDRDDTHR
jgi:hypothetical protein